VRVLIQTLGSWGDVLPFVAVGRALRARGHQVALLANEVFAAAIAGAGLECVPIGAAEVFRASLANPDLWHPTRSLGVVVREGIAPSLGISVERLRERVTADTVLVGSTLGFAARIVRELHDVPLVSAYLAPISFRTLHRVPRFAALPMKPSSPRWWKRLLWALIEGVSDRAVRPVLDPVRRANGLGPASRVFFDWIHSPDARIGLFPEWFGPPQPDWPPRVLTTGFCFEGDGDPLDPALDAWLSEGEPPIVFTHGSAQVGSRTFFAESVAAAAALGRRALLVAQSRDSVPAGLPPGMRHEAWVPFARLLPRVGLLVSHGGIGTCARALAAGVPHLAVPLAHDQFDNASRLEDLGTGTCLPARRYRAARAAAAIRALEGARKACARAAERLRGVDGAAAAADAIEAAARR
jgi:UDP:flavonoid glycosyltransferase YjiC (YdhE family)